MLSNVLFKFTQDGFHVIANLRDRFRPRRRRFPSGYARLIHFRSETTHRLAETIRYYRDLLGG
jgi:hypothetical protein